MGCDIGSQLLPVMEASEGLYRGLLALPLRLLEWHIDVFNHALVVKYPYRNCHALFY